MQISSCIMNPGKGGNGNGKDDKNKPTYKPSADKYKVDCSNIPGINRVTPEQWRQHTRNMQQYAAEKASAWMTEQQAKQGGSSSSSSSKNDPKSDKYGGGSSKDKDSKYKK